MAIQNGTACRLAVGATNIATAKSENFQSGMATRDTTTKSSAGNRELAEAIKSWSCDVSGLFNLSNTAVSPQTLQNSWVARTPITITFMPGSTVGYRNMTGSAYVVDLSWKADLEGNTEWSAKLEGTGDLTLTDH